MPAIGTCARCGTFVCATCATTRADGQLSCPACDERAPRLELATLGDRFWANLVDNLTVMFPGLVGFAVSALFKGAANATASVTAMALGGVLSLTALGFQLSLVRDGQSIGKKLRRIRVERKDGSPASFSRIVFLRNVVPLAARYLVPFGGLLGFVDVVMIFGHERRCLHDLIADTRVVKVPREARSVSPEVRVSG
jgi:uncharacterized RDD family membrane protein YckC